MQAEPIFVIGVQRSGTTLLAAMLNAHSELSCGPETHVFGHLQPYLDCHPIRSRILQRRLARDWPESALALLYAIYHAGTPVVHNHGFTEQTLRQYLERSPPSLNTLAATLPDLYRIRANKKRWIEKTPDNTRFVHIVRKLFPQAPIIRIVRDPRDVALSLAKTPWGPCTFEDALNSWIHHDSMSDGFFRGDRNSCTIKYEDLVTDPERVMRGLCRFIGEPFEPGMLETADSARDVNRTREPWKNKVGETADVRRAGVWRRTLSTETNRLAEMMAGDRMMELGYEVRNSFNQYCNVYPAVTPNASAAASELARQGYCAWKTHANQHPAMMLFLGDPDASRWLAGGSGSRIGRLIVIIRMIMVSRFLDIPVKWIPGNEQTDHPSKCGRLLASLLKDTLTQTPLGAPRKVCYPKQAAK